MIFTRTQPCRSCWKSILTLFLTAALANGCAEGATASLEQPVAESKPREAKALGVPPKYHGALKSVAQINVRDAVLQLVLPPLEAPWAFEFLSEQEVLLTQISGELSRIDLSTGEQTFITGLPKIGQGYPQIGLMDVTLHPGYSHNKRIYFSYARPDEATAKYHVTEVATGVLHSNELTELQLLLNNTEFGWAPSNFGGALAFDNDGHLYITVGERGEDVLVQDGRRLEGKILRLNDDGSVPVDNPFVDREGFDPRIFAIGVRNSQGLHFDKVTNTLFESEHGPLGGDEVNIIEAGRNYGWPTISYGSGYLTTKKIGEGTHKVGLSQPIYYFLPSIAASPITVYRGAMFDDWDGDILVGALKGEHVAKLDFDQGVVRSHQKILAEVGGRIRDIKIAGDGSIYVLSQTTGLHRLYREDPESATIEPAVTDEDSVPTVHPGKEYYDWICAGCHDSGASGAPVLGNYQQWQTILEQPYATTKNRVFNGYNAMPERGYCYVCKDEQLMEMVDYMLEEAKKNPPLSSSPANIIVQ